MKKGYSVESNIIYGDRFIIVSNLELINMVFNFGIYNFDKSQIEPSDVGVWKIKKPN